MNSINKNNESAKSSNNANNNESAISSNNANESANSSNFYISGFDGEGSQPDSNGINFECGSYWHKGKKITCAEIDEHVLKRRVIERNVPFHTVSWDDNDNECVTEYTGNLCENIHGRFVQIPITEKHRRILDGSCFSDHALCMLSKPVNGLITGTYNLQASVMAISDLFGIHKLKEDTPEECIRNLFPEEEEEDTCDIMESMRHWVSGNKMIRRGHRIESLSYSGIASAAYYQHALQKATELYHAIETTDIDVISLQETNFWLEQCYNDLCRRSGNSSRMLFIASSQEQVAGPLGFIIKNHRIRPRKEDIKVLNASYGSNNKFHRVIAAGLPLDSYDFTLFTIHRKVKESQGCEEVLQVLNELKERAVIAGDFNENIVRGLCNFKKLRAFYNRSHLKTTRSFYSHDIDHVIANFGDPRNWLDIFPPVYNALTCKQCHKNNKCTNEVCSEIHTQRRHNKEEKSITCCPNYSSCKIENCSKYHGCNCQVPSSDSWVRGCQFDVSKTDNTKAYQPHVSSRTWGNDLACGGGGGYGGGKPDNVKGYQPPVSSRTWGNDLACGGRMSNKCRYCDEQYTKNHICKKK
jgi:hypothetical protein